ncbi:MAG: glycosyltransferase family 1 protein [Candidatus Moranbacteria bacterium]|jgi:glycosyltransferase involved in cell wall biosynthesis|nr:glycosyltransferase family 1 protein [Candidatus Moranbacteria bacterium]MDD5652386.1 glycosyltransferase family 1 protein [Candidatus Moranbacteria bacterium]MDX9855778.1 glycosyltransferase family 1 protein [Candidatus Moranbacteria bacterium]
MKIAIQAADLDNNRIDGTRVYLLNVLKYLGKISPEDDFFIYHKKEFNPELVPPEFTNYVIKKVSSPFLWTQTRFAWEVWKEGVDVLWMPMHNAPLFGSKKTKKVVTIHDLAFKRFSEAFTKGDLFKLNLLTELAIKKADKIIAVSQSTKRDILEFYPEINPEDIRVIYHGFDAELFEKRYSEEKRNSVLKSYKLKAKSYILYVGAIQPRKNLKTLIRAFESLKGSGEAEDLKLVISGSKAWRWEDTIEAVEKSSQRENIILTGRVSFEDLSIIYRGASVFVFPSLYEGFGIPVLEAFASGVPAVVSRNSSLEEVGGEAVEYFDGSDAGDLSKKIGNILKSDEIQRSMVEKGKKRLKNFSWEKCARETLGFLKS